MRLPPAVGLTVAGVLGSLALLNSAVQQPLVAGADTAPLSPVESRPRRLVVVPCDHIRPGTDLCPDAGAGASRPSRPARSARTRRASGSARGRMAARGVTAHPVRTAPTVRPGAVERPAGPDGLGSPATPWQAHRGGRDARDGPVPEDPEGSPDGRDLRGRKEYRGRVGRTAHPVRRARPASTSRWCRCTSGSRSTRTSRWRCAPPTSAAASHLVGAGCPRCTCGRRRGGAG